MACIWLALLPDCGYNVSAASRPWCLDFSTPMDCKPQTVSQNQPFLPQTASGKPCTTAVRHTLDKDILFSSLCQVL